jgi:hypothetical protein
MRNCTSTWVSLILFIIISIIKVSGQESSKPLSLDNSPVEDQFNYVYQRSADFEDSKIVKRWQLTRLKTHVLDTIQQLRLQLGSSGLIIGEKDKEIDSLVQANAATQVQLEIAVREKQSLKILGIGIHKNTYNSIVWIIIAALAGSCAILILLYRRINSVTLSTKTDLTEVKQEFEAFRKRALEREEGIVRKYYDELNKYKNKTGKLS